MVVFAEKLRFLTEHGLNKGQHHEYLSLTEPLFSRPLFEQAADAKMYGIDLRRFTTIKGNASKLEVIWKELSEHPDIEHLYYAFLPAPPPNDLVPQTPDFSSQQSYLGSAPEGFGLDALSEMTGL